MKRRTFLQLSVLTPLALGASRFARAGTVPAVMAARIAPDGRKHRFTFASQQFMLDGQPFQIRGGQMDPIRIPRQYWRHRIRMARAMGLNTIACYLMWNEVEPEPGQFDFSSGSRDYAEFIRMCGEEGMWAYVRPGPYVCAEYDFGGLPAWLLRNPETKVRHGDNKPYMDAVARYFDALAPQLKPLMVDNGGPILMVQIENEYASFGTDLAYLETLQKMWRDRGIDGPFSLSDGLTQIQNAGTYVPGTALGLDGSTDFVAAQRIAGEAPVWVGEGYTGWLSHWGDKGFQSDNYASTLRQLMADGRSFNLYEVHGGTNFGFGAGANSQGDGSHFKADITSYDYGAPITEQGAANDDYHRFRTIIASALERKLPEIPATPAVARFGEVMPRAWASIWDQLASPRHVTQPQSNEILFGQNQGMVLYRTHVHLDQETPLHVERVHDYATVFADGDYVGTISRVQAKGVPEGETVMLPASAGKTTQIDILVDSFGHVGYGTYIRDGKGLVGAVHLPTRMLRDWQVFALPLDAQWMDKLKSSAQPTERPGIFFRATVTRNDAVDSYVDMSAWDKGYVWVNGHLLGRYWHIGPQQRLYCPAGWWKQGDNEVVIFDQHRTKASPIWGVLTL
ncbi:MAG TPA: beta-galactosidase [Oleiagrimonas sp.]|nr:beta-galactosidase [Oleiagrimonas sp.]